MLYTSYYGCCRLFQTTIKNCEVPYSKSTDLNRIQMTIHSLVATYKHYCTMLAAATVM